MIELQPSNDYPGRIEIIHALHPDSNSTTRIALTEEDIASLRVQLDRMGL